MSKLYYCLAIISCFSLITSVNSANAQILPSGDYTPTYNNLNPWNVGGELQIGIFGVGSMVILPGGTVNDTCGILGAQGSGVGTVNLVGPASQWNSSDSVQVGRFGTGVLNVVSGGLLTSNCGDIGLISTSMGTATVAAPGSNWNISLGLVVGFAGTGELNVEAGGVVSNFFADIGFESGSMGTATVTGSGSQWNTSSVLRVGGGGTSAGGTGILSIQDSGTVSVGGTVKIWDTGTVNLESGFLNAQSLDVTEPGSALNQTGGTLTIDGGTFSTTATNFFLDSDSVASTSSLIFDNGATWDHDAEVHVGEIFNATLDIQQGSVVSSVNGICGAFADSIGTTTVTGAGSQWNNSSAFFVGVSGTGELSVEAGGVVSSPFGIIGVFSDGMGTATVTGVGSQWNNSNELRVGVAGTGVLNVEAGGIVSTGEATIGHESGSNGTAFVDGADSTWVAPGNDIILGRENNSSGELTISNQGLVLTDAHFVLGDNGQGSLVVNSGGGIRTDRGFIGNGTNGNGIASVSGNSSSWIIANDSMNVGNAGNGTLNVEAGGVVTTNAGTIGFDSGSIGLAKVTGIDSQWNISTSLYVGGNSASAGGMGTLNIQDEGTVSVVDMLKVWDDGTVNLESGMLSAQTLDLLIPDATFNMTGGTLVVESVLGDLVQDGGAMAPGASPGLTTINGDYSLAAAGKIEVEIGGLIRVNEFDAIDVMGLATLNGTVDINLVSEFEPSLDDSFLIVNAGSFGGAPTFDFTNAILPAGLEWDSSTFTADGTISVVAAPIVLGDVNLDGLVNLLDVDPFIAVLSAGTFQAEADCDENGVVNLLDVDPFILILSGGP